MRRTYISPEFHNNQVYGTYNMVEESNFFAAKMLEIEDIIEIVNSDIIYYQKPNNEQIDIVVESTLQSYVFSSSEGKKQNHTLVIDTSQPKYQLQKDTKWILEINLKEILSQYIFSILKKYRTFEGLKNDMTLEKDVNVSIKKYIDTNVMNRYKFEKIDLFVKYQDLRNQNLLRYQNVWDNKLSSDDILTKFQSETARDYSSIKIYFNQQKPSETYRFDYFFNLKFSKL